MFPESFVAWQSLSLHFGSCFWRTTSDTQHESLDLTCDGDWYLFHLAICGSFMDVGGQRERGRERGRERESKSTNA